jgi:AcrR family transcriptional regulator
MAAAARLDGRVARSRRSRRAVVDALLALVEEGERRPTAARIAERAGLSLRSVFQHFADLEALHAETADVQFRRVVALAGPLKTDGPLAERLGALVRQRARVLEAMTPTRRSALLLAPSSPTIADRLADGHRLSRTHVARVFAPELGRVRGTARAELLAALSAAASWSTWEELRAHQGLTPARAERTLARMLRALLGKDD